ncbi:MAG: hypothetical protein ACHQ1G_12750 [Planctomycetota bacterium]
MGGPSRMLVDRALHHVGFLFLLCLASTFPWWAAAMLARAEFKSLLSALACSMRVFCYSICLLCILVAMLGLQLAPRDPRSTLLGWIHIGSTLSITIPSAWRSFRVTRLRLVLTVALGWGFSVLLFLSAWTLSPGFRYAIASMPEILSRR